MTLTQWLSVAGIAIDVLCTTLLIVLICKRAKVEAVKVDESPLNDLVWPDLGWANDPATEASVAEPKKVYVYKDRPPCPKCKSRNAYKNGKRHNGQAYRCRKCLNSYVAEA